MSQDTWNPKQYDRFKAERSQPFYDLMNLLEPVQNSVIVDLGCGTGELTADLQRHMNSLETIGIDNSSQMLLESKKFESSQIRFEKGDISLWCEPGKYDIVFSNAAIQWCENHEKIFSNIRKSLKPNGQLAIQMPMNHDYFTHTTAYELASTPIWKKELSDGGRESSMLPLENYASFLFKLGFKTQKVSTRVYGHILESREGVIEWVKGTLLNYYQSRLSEENFKKFLTEYKEKLFEKLPDEKPFFYPFKRALIWGRL